MKRLAVLCWLAALALGFASLAAADTTVKMTGDARVYANYWSQYQYTGWNRNGTRTADPLEIYERFRLRMDFRANSDLKFRLAMRVNDRAWGNSTFTVDNPAVVIDVYQAFLQFKWPGTQVEFTVGLQDMDMPVSVDWMGGNVVLGGTRAAGAVVEAPVNDAFRVVAGFTRLLDGTTASGALFQNTTTSKVDTLDGFFLALPVTVEGFEATPWAMLALAGRDANYSGTWVGNGDYTSENLYNNLFSAGTGLAPATLKNSMNTFWWAGTTVAVTVLDPFKFYGDIVYGEGNANDRSKNKRAGWFFDVGAEYVGFDLLTPKATFWYSSGEDSSMGNGSERLPSVVNCWGPMNSFLFDSNQLFNYGFMGTNPIGSMGVVVGLDKISFVKDLTHRLAFTYAKGTNSPRALRQANQLFGTGNYVQMGRDLADDENLLAVNFDNKYNLFENLALVMETGWSHGNFSQSVWGRRFTNAASNGDAWKVAFGFKYKF